MTAAEIKVKVIDHAKERCEERWPGFKKARMVDEVRAAILAGRLSAVKPSTLRGGDHPGGLYCWTEDEQRIYGVTAEEERFVVWTVMRVGLDN